MTKFELFYFYRYLVAGVIKDAGLYPLLVSVRHRLYLLS